MPRHRSERERVIEFFAGCPLDEGEIMVQTVTSIMRARAARAVDAPRPPLAGRTRRVRREAEAQAEQE